MSTPSRPRPSRTTGATTALVSPASRAAETASDGRARVLLVEAQAARRRLERCLSEDYEVLHAEDDERAIAIARRERPALIVSNVGAALQRGADLLRRLRAEPDLAATPILVVLEGQSAGLQDQLLAGGASEILLAPDSESLLLVRARTLLLAAAAREQAVQALEREQAARSEAEVQKQLLYELIMQAPTLITVLRGPDHVVELANPPMCRLWGKPPSEILGRPVFQVIPEFRGALFNQLLDSVYQSGVAHLGRETPVAFTRESGDTETLYFDFVYSPFRGLDGAVAGIFTVANEVTAQVLARQQLDSLRQAAESANRAKDEFLAMLGHELRNPLAPIVTALQLMRLQPSSGFERARDVIERQVTHLVRLVDDLLDVSRITRGMVKLDRSVVELGKVVAKGIEMVAPLLDERRHQLAVDVPAGLRVDGDPVRLGQVVSNLVSNAAKYTPPAGCIQVVARGDGEEVVLSVRDNGMGIAPEVLPHVFDLFVQEPQARDRSRGGLGLGLSIVRTLVELHGGSVSVQSAGSGQGSEVVVRLPEARQAHAPKAPRPAAPPRAPTPGSRRIRVLVVDDNADAADLLALALGERGYEQRVAHDPLQALRVAAELQPEIAVLDIGLPVMDGYELGARLRELPGLSQLHLVALTGYGQDSDRQRSRAAGFHAHLVKPVDLEALLAAIAERRPA